MIGRLRSAATRSSSARRIRSGHRARRVEHHQRERPLALPEAASRGGDGALDPGGRRTPPAPRRAVQVQLPRSGRRRQSSCWRTPDHRRPRAGRWRAPAPGAWHPAPRAPTGRRCRPRRRAPPVPPYTVSTAPQQATASSVSSPQTCRVAASDLGPVRDIVWIARAPGRSAAYTGIGAAPSTAHRATCRYRHARDTDGRANTYERTLLYHLSRMPASTLTPATHCRAHQAAGAPRAAP